MYGLKKYKISLNRIKINFYFCIKAHAMGFIFKNNHHVK